jgi:hypothetical protein
MAMIHPVRVLVGRRKKNYKDLKISAIFFYTKFICKYFINFIITICSLKFSWLTMYFYVYFFFGSDEKKTGVWLDPLRIVGVSCNIS